MPELQQRPHAHRAALAHRLGLGAAAATTRRSSARPSRRPCAAITGAPPAAVRFRDAERGRVALVTITLPGEQPLPSAHHHAGRIEEAVRERCPALADVIVHTEPEPAGAPDARQRRLIAAESAIASSTPA